ncbi:MAG: hypothetical protein DRH32_04505 [Deltaproteobacteria bacterium]|nr:MAG: hypothetical protein DRH32_04505 [Deltaproteobacteria bacterium]
MNYGATDMTDLLQQEKQVDEYIARNNTDAAVKLLYSLIVQYAMAKKITKAEALREKLFEVDAMALTEIVNAAEIIEKEKSELLNRDKQHMSIWADLYDGLTQEEANALYLALEKRTYDINQVIFRQGRGNSGLFFINQGKLKLVHTLKTGTVVLRTLTAGDIAGEDTFIPVSICTNSLIALTRVELSCLERSALQKLTEKYPGLEPKLHDFCLKKQKSSAETVNNGFERRLHQRINLSGRVSVRLLNAAGQPLGKEFRGELSDISKQGLCFFIRIPKQETVRRLLGRKLKLKFTLGRGENEKPVEPTGSVVAVSDRLFGDYSVHVKFDQLLEPEPGTAHPF